MSVPSRAKLRNVLGWAFVVSIALHLALVPLVARSKPLPPPPKTHSDPMIVVDLPSPTPRPKPTPPPPPQRKTPPPILQTAAPNTARPVVHVPRAHAVNVRAAQSTAYAPSSGKPGEGGDRGMGTGAGPAVIGPTGSPAPSPAPTPSPTPKPACAQPHVDASVTRAVEPEFPEIARRQGLAGVTQIRVTLTETGAIADARVYATSGSTLLDAAALAAARESSYSPEIDDCKKQAGSYLFRAEFSAQ